jgi:S-DNA-T family DNA segregation ATPase FtsK/SpoIIIE
VSNRNIYKEIELPLDAKTFRVGTRLECDFRLHKEDFFEDFGLDFSNNNGKWSVICSDNLYLSVGDTRRLLNIELEHGNCIIVKYQESDNELFKMEFTVDFDSKTRRFERCIAISSLAHIRIGASPENNIIIKSKYIQHDQVELQKNKYNTYLLRIINASYGVYVNGERIHKAFEIKDGDFFAISDILFYFKDNCLWTEADANCQINGLNYKDFYERTDYPKFIRTTRVKSEIDEEPIKILDPDTLPVKPEMNLVTTLMPTLMMFALVVVLRGIMSESKGTYVIFSICSMGMGVVTSVLNIINSQKKYKKEIEKRKTVYADYIEKKRQEIIEARRQEVICLKERYYSTEQDLQHLIEYDSTLFDRLPEDNDFLDVYLGVGPKKAIKKIEYKEQEKLEVEDEIAQIPTELAKEFEYLQNAPIVLKLRNANSVGVVGSKEQLNDIFRCITVDLVSRQHNSDLNIYAFLNDNIAGYEWIRMIPHFQYGNFHRNIICDNQSKNNVFESLYKELTLRTENPDLGGYNVILIMEERGIKNHPISRFIETASELNTVFIFFEQREEHLPLHCSQIVELKNKGEGCLFDSANRKEKQLFSYSSISDDALSRASQKISPSYCDEISLEGTLRKSISFFELLKIYSVDDINLEENWKNSKVYETMEAPIGVNAKDEIVSLNLHEKYHGPHGLVAGTTGSGKSEILQSYILSAAIKYHPYEIGFVIIDFKGGGMVNQFRNLPHLIGAITNIDGNEIQRSLKSIKAELMKRQSFFASAGVNHIDKYIKLYKEGKVSEALPHLIIIVDEFAELKAEQPEFMKELISAARIGRSLGVHLILATQKPSGVVDAQIWSNSKFKLCLKVQSKEDSNEVIKTPLAAEIKEPGRAYLQVGNNEIFELFQSAYSGAPAIAEASENEKTFVINKLNFAGNRTPVYVRQKKKNSNASAINQLEAIIDYISKYCEKSNISRLPNICMPPLATNLLYSVQNNTNSDVITANIGIYDDPDHQAQHNYDVNCTATNYMIIGSTQTGKTNLLQTMIRSLADNYSPADINLYIIDFGSMILRNFNELKHVGGVVCSYEDEKLKSLFRMLNKEVSARKIKLSNAGVSSYSSYREAGHRDLPQIVVFIDNLTALKELYLQDEDYLLPLCRDGVTVGISFVIANGQTAGIGYRYLNNFEGRIAMFCNETSEYGMLFEGNRIKLASIAGRMLVQLDKTVYEAQSYIAFKGEKEFERVAEIKSYIANCNERFKDVPSARIIPEIPAVLSSSQLCNNFEINDMTEMIPIGLNYETVAPCCINIKESKFLSLIGRKDSDKDKFIREFIKLIGDSGKDIELYILDDMQSKWGDFEFDDKTEFYSNSTESIESIISELGQRLKSRYENALARVETSDSKWILLIIESMEAVSEISKNKSTMPVMKDIIEKYYEMNVLVMFTNIPNASISFNAPELLKMVKDNKNYIIFDDISNVKVTDISTSVARKNAKPVDKNDAYLISDGDLIKVKVIS